MNEPAFTCSLLTFALLPRLCETSLTGKYADVDGNVNVACSIGLARSQEPFVLSDDLMVSDQFLPSHFTLVNTFPSLHLPSATATSSCVLGCSHIG